MNEFESRGFHIIDLAYMSKSSANVDFIASKNGSSFNIQVKGASNVFRGARERWWVQYGYCDEDSVSRTTPIFNKKDDFALKANFIVLIAVNSPSKYRVLVLPVKVAEQLAQLNMDSYYRQKNRNGLDRKPNKLWIYLDATVNPRVHCSIKDEEREILLKYQNQWNLDLET
ncbi:hypothetical protein [Sandaracinobacteroides hominis]|uniref:hypothetical protein n=1 Tax=Sandaracinobacteroides hominis TaxID=2780086 RepID=UPI0018F7508E|nr:hypothetical protein [Sandaracinobacteroides hominis]